MNPKFKQIVFAVGWFLVLFGGACIAYSTYVAIFLYSVDSLRLFLPMGSLYHRIEFLYNSIAVLVAFILGIGILRRRKWVLRILVLAFSINILAQAFFALLALGETTKMDWFLLSIEVLFSAFVIWLFRKTGVPELLNS